MLVLSPNSQAEDMKSSTNPMEDYHSTKHSEKDYQSITKSERNFHMPLSTLSSDSSQSGLQSKVDSEVLRVIDVLNKKLKREEEKAVQRKISSEEPDSDEQKKYFDVADERVPSSKTGSRNAGMFIIINFNVDSNLY